MLAEINVSNNQLRLVLRNDTANIEYASTYDSNWDIDLYSMKTSNNTARNNYLDVHTNNYSSQDTGNGSDIIFQNLYVAQITPYYQLANEDITLYERINLDFTGQTTVNFTYNVWWTTDSDASQWIDRRDWVGVGQVWQLITDAELQQYANKTIVYSYSTESATTNSQPYVDIPITITSQGNRETIWLFMSIWTQYISTTNITQDRTNRHLFVNTFALNADIIPTTQQIEVVDIPGLMFTVLTMPFAFISQAFDLTLFPGTAYQINISQLFLGLIGVAMLLWVLKIILGRANIGDLLNDSQKARNDRKLEKLQHQNKMEREEQRHQNAMIEKNKKD